jgi:hypothetical protein
MDWQAFWLTARLAALVAAVLVLWPSSRLWITTLARLNSWRKPFRAACCAAADRARFYVLVATGPPARSDAAGKPHRPHLAFTFGSAIGSIVYGFRLRQPAAASLRGRSATDGGVATLGFPVQNFLSRDFALIGSGLVTGVARGLLTPWVLVSC